MKKDYCFLSGSILFLVAFTTISKIVDYDIFWHLKIGEIIFNKLSVLSKEIFSYTVAGKPFVNQEWLSQVLFFFIYDLFGFNGLIFFKAVLAAAIFLILFKTAAIRNQNNLYIIFWFTVLTLILCRFRLDVRPHVISFLFLTIFSYFIYDFLDSRRKTLFFLPVLMILWVNLHFECVFGLSILAIVSFCELLKLIMHKFKFNVKYAKPWKSVRHLLVVLLLSGAAVLSSPDRLSLFSHIKATYDVVSTFKISECMPPFAFHFSAFPLFWFSLILYSCVLAVAIRRLDITDAFLFIFLVICALKMIRFIPIYALVSMTIVAKYIPYASITGSLRKVFSNKLIIALAILLIAVFPRRGILYAHDFGLGLSETRHPIGAIRFLEKNKISGNVFNDILFGGHIILFRFPENKVFIDGRLIVFGRDIYEKYNNILMARIPWEESLDRYNVNVVLLGKGLALRSPLMVALAKNENWKPVYIDQLAIIFLRNTPENLKIIEKNIFEITVRDN